MSALLQAQHATSFSIEQSMCQHSLCSFVTLCCVCSNWVVTVRKACEPEAQLLSLMSLSAGSCTGTSLVVGDMFDV